MISSNFINSRSTLSSVVFMLCCILTTMIMTSSSIVDAAPFSVQPTTPIPRVPFRITDEGPLPPAGTFVYISVFSSCNTTSTGTLQQLNPNAATFTVAADNTVLYLCMQATSSLVYTINLQRIFLFPGWAPPNTAQTVDVTPALPDPAVLEFHSFASCATPIVASTTIDAASATAIVPGFNGIRFPCAKFTDIVTSAVQNILLDSFQTFSGLGFLPNTTVINKQETFFVSGVSNDGSKIRWTRNADCSDVINEFVLSSYQFTTTVSAARGTYHFCWDVSNSGSSFISLGTFTVNEFSSLPTTAFVNKNLRIRLTDDSPFTTSFIIADINCQNNVFGNQFSVDATGTQVGSPISFAAVSQFYVCVAETSDTSSLVRADRISIVDLYVANFANPTNIVRGVPATVTASAPAPASSTYFAASDATCATQYGQNFTTTAFVGYLVMPTSGVGSTAATFYLCAYTADGTSFASIAGPFAVRDYLLQINSPVQGIDVGTVLDGATPLPASVYLSSGNSCGAKSASLANFTTTLSLAFQIQFPATGATSICYESRPTVTTRLAAVTVLAKASFTPPAAFVGTSQTITIANAPSTSMVIQIVDSASGVCPTFPGTAGTFLFNSTVTAAGTSNIQVNFPSQTNYRVCASYQNIISGTFFTDIGIIAAITANISPRYFVETSISTAAIIIPSVYGPVTVQQVYLGTSSACNEISPTPIFPSFANGTTLITPPASSAGQRWGCFKTANMTLANEYGTSQNITIYPAVTPTFTQAFGGVQGVPFFFTFPTLSWNYMPTQFFLSTDSNICDGSKIAASGLFNTATGSTVNNVSLQQTTSPYSLCVSAPQVPGFSWLRAGQLTVNKFTAVTRTFIHGINPVVVTTPTLPTFKFFLMASSTCTGAARYDIDVTAPVAATIPIAATYHLCVYDPGDASWVSGSSNTVSVVAAFSAILPSPIRGETPFTATITSDIVAPSVQRVYLKAGLNQICAAATDTRIAEFFGTTTTTVSITIPYRTNVTLCAVSMDNSTSVAVASIPPDPYTTPSEIVANDIGPIRVLLGDGTTAPAGTTIFLTHAADCVVNERGPIAVQTGGFFFVDFPSSYNGPQQLFVCERPASGVITVKDYIFVLDTFGSNIVVQDGGFPRWGDLYWPGQPIQLAVAPSVGTNPFLSNARNCSGSDSVNPATYGVFPPEGANRTYYVCITSKRGTLVSAPQPLRFAAFDFIPNIAVTDLMTPGYFFPPLPRFTTTNNGVADPFGGTYFSRNADCSNIVSGPYYWNISSGMFPGASGMVYVCVYPGDGSVVMVKSFYAYQRAPLTVQSQYQIWGEPYCVLVSAPVATDTNRAWSIYEDAVTPIPVPNPTTTRRWFYALAGTNCTTEVTPKVKLGSPTAPFCLETSALNASITQYDFCGPTPFGEVPYILAQTYNYVMSNYTGGYVYGALTTVPSTFSPFLPTTNFGWAKTTDCTTRLVAPDFTTSTTSTFNIDFRTNSAFRPANAAWELFTPGTYWLCKRFFSTSIVATALDRRQAVAQAVVNNQYYAVSPVFIGRVEYYSINIDVLIATVPTTIVLEQDLYFSYLAGISTSESCSPLDTTSTTFTAVAGDNRSAVMTHLLNTNGVRTVCARSPVNGSVFSAGQITIVPSQFLLSPEESACDTFIVAYSDPNSQYALAADGTMQLVRGACCPAGGVATADLLSGSTRVPGNTPVHSFFVEAGAILAMNSTTEFSLCYSSATLGTCLAAGRMNITQTSCSSTNLPTSGTQDPNSQPLSANALIAHNGPFEASNQVTETVIVSLLFVVLLVILILLCLFCFKRGTVPAERADRRKKNPFKPGDPEGDTFEEDKEADSFGLLFSQNRTESAVGAFSPRNIGSDGQGGEMDFYAISAGLPISTTLDFCHEPTNDSLALEAEERREREDINLCEQFLFEKMRRSYVTELKALASYAVGQDRARLISHGNQILRETRDRFMDTVEEARAEIEREEQEEMYEISLLDQEGYRNVADYEGNQLNAAYQGEQASWSARREALARSGHGRAIEVGGGNSQPRGLNRSDPLLVDNFVRETNSPKGQRSVIGGGNDNSAEREYRREDLAPPPPLVEPYAMQSPSRSNINAGADRDLPHGPGPSPPPLAIRGDPLLHFTVPPPNNAMMSRLVTSPANNNNNDNNMMDARPYHNSSRPSSTLNSGRQGGAAATPFKDPFAGTNQQYSPSSGQRNPLHQPLTPSNYSGRGNYSHQMNNNNNQHVTTPPHVVEENSYHYGGGNNNNNNGYYDDQEMRTFGNPSHASRPMLSSNSNNNSTFTSPSSFGNNNNNNNNSRNSYYNNGRQDPAANDIYRAPRR